MDRRVFGLETEFGCLVRDPALGTPEDAVELVKNHAFREMRLGVIDLHARDFAFEPAAAGGFLTNGGRLYVDAVGDHEEYATPECTTLRELITWDRAGRVIVQRVLEELEIADEVSFHCNAIDHFGGHTFGCHENYLVELDDENFVDAVRQLLPYLVTRQIFAGSGRVGGHRLARPSSKENVLDLGEHEVDTVWVSNFYGVEIDRDVTFQLSQRADHIVRVVSSRVRFNRALINPKWETRFDFGRHHRLHVLFGEANMSEYASMLKVGTMHLVLSLIEEGLAPKDLEVRDPLWALREVSRDPRMRWLVQLEDDRTIPAVDIQRRYLSAARRSLAGRDEDTDWVLREWERTLNDLERDPLSTSDRLDWSAKKALYDRYVSDTGIEWDDDVLQSLDLEYHNVNPAAGLAMGLELAGELERVTTDEEVACATGEAPPTTRAAGRGDIVRTLLDRPGVGYVIDWDGVQITRGASLEMRDPFCPYRREAARLSGAISRLQARHRD